MKESIKQFVKICAETLPISEPIYEFGSLQVPGQEGFADLRPFFSGKYIGTDMQEGTGVDMVLNLHNLDLLSESVGTALVLETLEHVEFVNKAMEEIYRVLKPNGILIMSSVMNFPIHNYPNDYWRFTPEAFKSLLKPFDFAFVEFLGQEDFPHTIVGAGIKGKISVVIADKFITEVKRWKARQKYTLAGLVKLFAPPVILPMLKKIYRKK